MRKGLSTVLLAPALIVLLLASPVGAAKRKITWWIPNDPIWKLLHDRFEKENPGVDVTMVFGEVDKFYTMITAGLMPDVWGPWATPGIQADVNRNWAVDLTPYLKRDAKEIDVDDFFPGMMRQFKVGGKQYSLPAFCNIDYFFYNPSMWAEAGLNPPPLDSKDTNWSWDRMVEAAIKTTKMDGNRIKQAGITTSVEWFSIPNWFHIWGAFPYSQEAIRTSVPQKMHLNTPEMVTALTKVWELKYKHNVFNYGGFLEGKTAASMENGYLITNIAKYKKLKWGIRNLPWGATNSGSLFPNGWRISKVAKNKDLAWSLVKFLCSDEALRLAGTDAKSDLQFTAPVRKSVFKETLGKNIGNVTGMNPADVYRVAAQADDVGIVKYQESVCLHVDMDKFMAPELAKVMDNKVGPKEGAANMQSIADKRLPELFKRWMRNVQFTGADKKDKPNPKTEKGGLI